MARQRKRVVHWLRKRNNIDPADCITAKEFAKRENIAVQTVYYWLSTGKAIGRKCNGIWWVKYPCY